MKQTSIVAYTELRESGELGRQHLRAVEALKAGDKTANEVAAWVDDKYGATTHRHNYNARCSELRDDWGMVKEVGSRPCTITGVTATVFHLIEGAVPVRIERPENLSTKQKLKRALELLEAADKALLLINADPPLSKMIAEEWASLQPTTKKLQN